MANSFDADVFVPLGAAFLGSLAGGALTLAGVFLTNRDQTKRDRLVDERALRDSRLERLLRAYSALITAASHFSTAAAYLASALDESDPGAALSRGTDQWYFTQMPAVRDAARQAQASLFLDSDRSSVERVVGLYQKVQVGYWDLRKVFDSATSDGGGKARAQESRSSAWDDYLEISKGESELIDASRENLLALQRPI